jgi:prepilin-type N-terminal cleavage/methylation domain-containing protein
MKYLPALKHRHRGFSLVELLIVIAVIGVIAAIAIPNLAISHGSAREAAAKRNAQQIASTFGAGEATGAPGFVAASSLESAVNAVGAGSYGAGINNTTFFQVPNVSFTMDDRKPLKEQATHYLSWTGSSLVYNENGVAAPVENTNPWQVWGPVYQDDMNAILQNLTAAHPENEYRISTESITPGWHWMQFRQRA